MTNIHRNVAFLVALAALTLSASPAAAQAKHETQAQLKAEAKISMAAAKKTALAQVPKGWVKSSELERENGKLLYSFDIATKGKSGIDEVQIDAITGAQIGSVVRETPAAEKKEAKAEAKEAKAEMKAMKKP
jgi:uncharacterized membrane protein YkoI